MNKAQCSNCKDIIESKFTHDFVSCKCSIESSNKIHECALIITEKLYLDENQAHLLRCYLHDSFGTGFSVDGGKDYCKRSGNFSHIIELGGNDEEEQA